MFERICEALVLGQMTAASQALSGGFTHRMFRLDTTQGVYAVKLLNPEIMMRPDALANYRAAEAGERRLEAAGIPILPAISIGGKKLQCVDGRYLYVFAYYPGAALQLEELTEGHCSRIGAVLAEIHRIDVRQCCSAPVVPAPAAWREMAQALLKKDSTREEGLLLQSGVPMLERAETAAAEAMQGLPQIEALCHNDMDPKNVLWQGEEFRIIDLECVGYANPAQEMLDLAIAWSGGEEIRFKAFVESYISRGGVPAADAAAVYDSRRNYLDWLSYNAKRALAEDVRERDTARRQIRWTLEKIRGDQERREQILHWLREVQAG